LRFETTDGLGRAAGMLRDASPDADDLTLRVPSDGGVADLRALLDRLDGVAIEDLSIHTPDLDDVFLALTGTDREQVAS
jgi:ABC-2 type transport system ATP-binding protein